MRVRILFAVLFSGCAEPRPAAIAPPLAVVPLDAGAQIMAVPDAGPTTPPSCAHTPCPVASNVSFFAIVGRDVFFVRQHPARAALVRHALDDGTETELVHDVRPILGDNDVETLVADPNGIAIGSHYNVAVFDLATTSLAAVFHDRFAITDIALDATAVYVLARDGGVKRAPRSGGPPVVLAKGTGRPRMALVLRLDGPDVFFGSERTISAVPRVGGPVRTLVTLPPDTLVYSVIPSGDTVLAMTNGSAVIRVPKSGGAPVAIAEVTERSGIGVLAADDHRVFWLEDTADYHHVVRSAARDGSGPAMTGTENHGRARSLVAAGDSLYFLTHLPNATGSLLVRLDK